MLEIDTAVEKWQTGVETRFVEKISHRKTVGQSGKHGLRLPLKML